MVYLSLAPSLPALDSAANLLGEIPNRYSKFICGPTFVIKMPSDTSGFCLCGASAYSYTDEPVMRALCYCTPCRKVSGGTNTVTFAVPEEKFTVTKGQPKSYAVNHEYGMALIMFFCPDCGTTLWMEATAPQFKGLKLIQAGTLTDAKKLNDKVDAEFYVLERASWLVPIENAAQSKDFEAG
ncbi:Mss4-like protein [Fusarium oxysporum Fo47]|uniref:Mss4-like protein n=1 Tax=Fusarium oxysporum Fo47 TaxID=660027 RepID=UPI002869D8C6|nr:Mss4-like protein [Fusarium oxysporum Fo47]QKD56733.2 Mss4-like protein [Fusarium oxysporum Fo47]